MYPRVSKAIPITGNSAKRPKNWIQSFQGTIPTWLAANQTSPQSKEDQTFFEVQNKGCELGRFKFYQANQIIYVVF